jgi:ribosomal protein S21
MKKNKKKFHKVREGVGTSVEVVDGNLNAALREFKRLVKDSVKLKEVVQRKHYTKPSVKKRKIRLDAIYQSKKNLPKN